MNNNMKMSPAMEALSHEQIQVLYDCLMAVPPEQRGDFEEKMIRMTPEQLIRFTGRAGSMDPEDIQRDMERIARMTPEQRRELAERRAKMLPEEMAKLSREKEEAHQEKHAKKPAAVKGKPKDAGGSFRRLLAYLGKQKAVLLWGMVTAVLATVFSLAAPKIVSFALDRLQVVVNAGGRLQFGKVITMLVILGVVYVFNLVFSSCSNLLFSKATQETLYQMRKDVDQKLMKLPFSYFDSIPRGDVLSRMTNDIENVGTSLQQSMGQIVTAVLTIAGSLVMMFNICWWLTLLCLLTIPCSILISRSILKRSQISYRAQWQHVGKLNAVVEEIYSGANVVKAFGTEEEAMKAFQGENGELYEASKEAQYLSYMINPSSTFFNNIAYILICALGAGNVLRGTMSLGSITALLQYQKLYSSPVSQIAAQINNLQSALASAERVFALLDQAEETQKEPAKPLAEPVRGDIEFRHLGFGYTPDKILMHDVDVSVKAGQMVAIVGPTGAGKTTLVNLLMRFYEPNRGGITIDGVDISEITRRDLRSVFGMVLQETWLFSGSIRDNICYGRENVSEEELLTAARSARIDHFVNTFEDGYDTVLNEDASNISQGQKQLITIARAMIANPSILILDEATSSVDTRTEAVIQQAINNLLKDRTSFVIAHRLSTIRNANLILVMKNGDVVEQGTHESLMEQNGLYADLYLSQFERS
ncbi:MAG: ABC transporter transmembrane domain-containing protein [Eubacteriales bacterium]|nr:ABC transporter transmembrane domain-containing protein [Eubacteriales bacterium]